MRRIVLIVLVMALAGCATASRSRPEQAHVWRNQNGVEVISDGPACHRVIRLNPQSNANEWVDVPCKPVVITNDPADEEFWTFMAHPEKKVQMTIMYGLVPVGPPIPAGRYAVNFRVVGAEAACEAARVSIARGRPVNDLESGASGVPTEFCLGPSRFKRTEGKANAGDRPMSPGPEAVPSSVPEPSVATRPLRPPCNNPIPSSCAP